MWFGMLAVADEGGADHNKNDAGPARGGNFFIKEDQGRKSRHHKAERRQRPKETDVAARHEQQKTGEEKRLEEDAYEDIRIGDAAADDASDLSRGDLFNITDLSNAFFEEDDAGGFEDQSDEQN